MAFLPDLLLLPAGYLLGSIPFGWLAGRWLAGIDMRQEGSGSTGATNVLRVLGKGPALAVFLLDVLKGTAAVLLAKAVLQPLGAFSTASDWGVVAAGLAALAGHIWPVWLGWKGGKAVATGLGMLLGLTWPVGLACFGLFLTTLSLSRIVSLSSVVAALSLPLLMLGSFGDSGLRPAYLSLALLTTALVLWRHRSNLQRLMAGTEPRLGAGRS
ncbi:MAG: glycerol-3-phosphate 1-O-acyltransferase PlsY [Aphanothece saxicola GSE-SYN-MK-01-06B]|jgi:glycerol-3-phosphate acyltransferase PlsY|nr:glycerol-3-phosphate 1-O-acyltransferase PlsY [Aphanothece saxicola GSE-SYN-MK-01-06B]